eukprot:GHVN01093267.1.p1 GENE.GHVN01093267.1~~GHVN01093267.1.p1  ORF type:complete len:105 (+),score=5.40 GHVN01093267.1:632-946(+)
MVACNKWKMKPHLVQSVAHFFFLPVAFITVTWHARTLRNTNLSSGPFSPSFFAVLTPHPTFISFSPLTDEVHIDWRNANVDLRSTPIGLEAALPCCSRLGFKIL